VVCTYGVPGASARCSGWPLWCGRSHSGRGRIDTCGRGRGLSETYGMRRLSERGELSRCGGLGEAFLLLSLFDKANKGVTTLGEGGTKCDEEVGNEDKQFLVEVKHGASRCSFKGWSTSLASLCRCRTEQF